MTNTTTGTNELRALDTAEIDAIAGAGFLDRILEIVKKKQPPFVFECGTPPPRRPLPLGILLNRPSEMFQPS